MKCLNIYIRTVICSLRNMFCFDAEHICFMNELIFPTLDSDSTWLIYFSFFPDSIVNIPRKISWMGDFLVFLLLYALSEICSVLMRNIYVSWKFKHFVPDYGKKIPKSWKLSLLRNRIDKYMFYFFRFPSPILRERWVTFQHVRFKQRSIRRKLNI